MNAISSFVKEKRKSLHLTQEMLAQKAGVGLRFVRELEQGKESLRMDKVNQVLSLFGAQTGAVPAADVRAYRLTSMDEPSDYQLQEIMHQVSESAIRSTMNAQRILAEKLEKI